MTPTYNERENLPILAAGVLAHPGFRMLVVDDASPDGTGEVAEELAQASGTGRSNASEGPRGLGRSYIDGLRHALKSGADLIFQMDADLSHNLNTCLASPRRPSKHDVVIGSST